jgi:pyruvate/2-oxoglutarate dehydrogenase complex dihydrolipoamide dehydrogenase (E3) component
MSQTYDVVVLGAGPVGENVADYAHRGGMSVAIVESELVGGECSYWACMPSKALLRPLAALADARAVAGSAQAVTGPLDVEAVLARRNAFTHDWQDDGQVAWLASAGIDLVRGRGRLAGEKRVMVDKGVDDEPVELLARHAVVISTGTTALVPGIPGLNAGPFWTSREATSAKQIPERLAIIGGGVVGCEMATAFAAFGAKVTLIAREERLLARTEPFAGEMVASALREAHVDVRLELGVSAVRRPGGATGRVVLETTNGGAVEADRVLVAAGRAPRTSAIGLDTVGLPDGSWLTVDDTCQVVDVPGGWLYATGDVNRRALLTHQGKYQGRACGSVIAARANGRTVHDEPWGEHVATADHAAVPQVVFTHPEVAAVGLTADEARQAGHPVRVVDYQIGSVAGAALYADGYQGRARMVVDTERELVLGVTLVGPGVAELLHAATTAVVGEVPLSRLWHAVPSYPTVSELWLRLLEEWKFGADS